MEITWHLNCTKEEAVKELQEHIDGPLSLAFMGKNYKGFISDDSFSIWSKLDRFGSRTAVAKGCILSKKDGSLLEATVKVPFPFCLLPDSAKFYWIAVPITVLLWASDAVLMVTGKYPALLSVTFPLTMIGIMIMFLGFIKMMGSDNKKLLEKKLRSIFQKNIN